MTSKPRFIGGPLDGQEAAHGRAAYRSATDGRTLRASSYDSAAWNGQFRKIDAKRAAKLQSFYVLWQGSYLWAFDFVLDDKLAPQPLAGSTRPIFRCGDYLAVEFLGGLRLYGRVSDILGDEVYIHEMVRPTSKGRERETKIPWDKVRMWKLALVKHGYFDESGEWHVPVERLWSDPIFHWTRTDHFPPQHPWPSRDELTALVDEELERSGALLRGVQYDYDDWATEFHAAETTVIDRLVEQGYARPEVPEPQPVDQDPLLPF